MILPCNRHNGPSTLGRSVDRLSRSQQQPAHRSYVVRPLLALAQHPAYVANPTLKMRSFVVSLLLLSAAAAVFAAPAVPGNAATAPKDAATLTLQVTLLYADWFQVA